MSPVGPPDDGRPGVRTWTGERPSDVDLIRLALALAGRTVETADVPIGAVVVSAEGVTVGEGFVIRRCACLSRKSDQLCFARNRRAKPCLEARTVGRRT